MLGGPVPIALQACQWQAWDIQAHWVILKPYETT